MVEMEVLVRYKKKLELCLKDRDQEKLCTDLLRHKVITKDVHQRFSSLNSDRKHLESEVKVRYLLQQVCDRVKGEGKLFYRLIQVLSRFEGLEGVCGAIREEREGRKASIGARAMRDIRLAEEDIEKLVCILVSGSHMWEEIGIALGLPKHVRVQCANGSSFVRLTNIITEWISGGYDQAKSPTLYSLWEVLACVVGLGEVAQKLRAYEQSKCSLSVLKETGSSNTQLAKDTSSLLEVQDGSSTALEVSYQSYDTQVADGYSTLLEVETASNGNESYQWYKDGQPLFDGADCSGVCTNMLYINIASQVTEGKYCCCVSNGSETVCSDEINLTVIYPPEKMSLMKHYSLMEREVPEDSWPPVSNTTFINLVLVKHKPMSKCDYYSVRGDMDDILEEQRISYICRGF